jgi:hypothetical protein
LKHDARNLPFENQFDVAIMLCEGGFPLMETDEMNFEILKNVTKSLKILLNSYLQLLMVCFPYFIPLMIFMKRTNEEGAHYKSDSFDLMTMRDYNVTTFIDDDGNEHKLECNERYYMPSEINWMLKSLGFKKIDIFGAKLGAYSREDKLATEDYEMLVVAEK